MHPAEVTTSERDRRRWQTGREPTLGTSSERIPSRGYTQQRRTPQKRKAILFFSERVDGCSKRIKEGIGENERIQGVERKREREREGREGKNEDERENAAFWGGGGGGGGGGRGGVEISRAASLQLFRWLMEPHAHFTTEERGRRSGGSPWRRNGLCFFLLASSRSVDCSDRNGEEQGGMTRDTRLAAVKHGWAVKRRTVEERGGTLCGLAFDITMYGRRMLACLWLKCDLGHFGAEKTTRQIDTRTRWEGDAGSREREKEREEEKGGEEPEKSKQQIPAVPPAGAIKSSS
ncbi:uncharacterized protein CIMG_12817 [Coccidioides immitis RS]|uniref:Uncharacterized protein n=1 Tax=Coccidioides immitis (strain RS) TaxID=246410 RepID=A0A0D8JTG0_COCIM|nr:uncharacterized protein CIMG_12817 [Coccidioides immitis RS]KJF60241.1 hypothetical protein CIMG_12817 [Coccidioides immitis RS]